MLHRSTSLALVAALALTPGGCDDDTASSPSEETSAANNQSSDEPEIEAGTGVDLEKRTIHVGALNDESGPAAGPVRRDGRSP